VIPAAKQTESEPNFEPTALLAIVGGRRHLPNYAYIIFDPLNRNAILIDPGWDPEFIKRVIANRALRLHGIFISHSHKDHWWAAPELAKTSDCPVYISKAEAKASGIAKTEWRLFNHEDVFIFGRIQVRTLLTPGHTIGSACFLASDRLFTGDTLFMEGCGLCVNPGGNEGDMFDTMRFLKNTINHNIRVFPGHKYRYAIGQPFGELLRTNIYLRIQDKALFIEFCGRNARQSNRPPPLDTKALKPSRAIDFCRDCSSSYKAKTYLERSQK